MDAADLTEVEIDVLRELSPGCSDVAPEWRRPLDIGGHSRSHHSRTLAKLVRLGLVQERQRSARGPRGSKEYCVTRHGRDILAAAFGPQMTKAEFDEHFARLVAEMRARKAELTTATTTSAA